MFWTWTPDELGASCKLTDFCLKSGVLELAILLAVTFNLVVELFKAERDVDSDVISINEDYHLLLHWNCLNYSLE